MGFSTTGFATPIVLNKPPVVKKKTFFGLDQSSTDFNSVSLEYKPNSPTANSQGRTPEITTLHASSGMFRFEHSFTDDLTLGVGSNIFYSMELYGFYNIARNSVLTQSIQLTTHFWGPFHTNNLGDKGGYLGITSEINYNFSFELIKDDIYFFAGPGLRYVKENKVLADDDNNFVLEPVHFGTPTFSGGLTIFLGRVEFRLLAGQVDKFYHGATKPSFGYGFYIGVWREKLN